MIIAFFESLKHLGHIWPLTLTRVYVGWIFLSAGIKKFKGGWLDSSIVVETVNKWIAGGTTHPTYTHFLQDYVVPHWKVFSYVLVGGEILVGAFLILGFIVRPMTLLAIFFSFNFMLAGASESVAFNQLLIVINVTMFIIGAGRAVGLDYYFYKRVRGIWW